MTDEHKPLTPEERDQALYLVELAVDNQLTWNNADELAAYLKRALADLESLQTEASHFETHWATAVREKLELMAECDSLRSQLAAQAQENARLKLEKAGIQQEFHAVSKQALKTLEDWRTIRSERERLQAALDEAKRVIRNYLEATGKPGREEWLDSRSYERALAVWNEVWALLDATLAKDAPAALAEVKESA